MARFGGDSLGSSTYTIRFEGDSLGSSTYTTRIGGDSLGSSIYKTRFGGDSLGSSTYLKRQPDPNVILRQPDTTRISRPVQLVIPLEIDQGREYERY
jgi:hypothetical protein